ncbi:unnamed protein product [Gadus morhua 'NCC']
MHGIPWLVSCPCRAGRRCCGSMVTRGSGVKCRAHGLGALLLPFRPFFASFLTGRHPPGHGGPVRLLHGSCLHWCESSRIKFITREWLLTSQAKPFCFTLSGSMPFSAIPS